MKCWRCGEERSLFKCPYCKELKAECPEYNQRHLRAWNKEISESQAKENSK